MVHIAAEPVKDLLTKRRQLRLGLSTDPPQHQDEMQHDHVETATDRVWHPIIAIEYGGSRLRHDHAIDPLNGRVRRKAAKWG